MIRLEISGNKQERENFIEKLILLENDTKHQISKVKKTKTIDVVTLEYKFDYEIQKLLYTYISKDKMMKIEKIPLIDWNWYNTYYLNSDNFITNEDINGCMNTREEHDKNMADVFYNYIIKGDKVKKLSLQKGRGYNINEKIYF